MKLSASKATNLPPNSISDGAKYNFLCILISPHILQRVARWLCAEIPQRSAAPLC